MFPAHVRNGVKSQEQIVTANEKGRRLGERIHARAPGKIVDDANCLTDVTVLDLSSSGARIEIPYAASLPRAFRLRVARDGSERLAEPVWRSGTEAGVRFLCDNDLAAPTPAPLPPPVAPRISLADLRKLAQKAKS